MPRTLRRTLLTTLTVAGIFLAGLASHGAVAMNAPPPGATTMPAIEKITNVCGSGGCVRVQTQRIKHHKPMSTMNHI